MSIPRQSDPTYPSHQNRTIIVTGGSQGLGQDICVALGRKKANLVVVDLTSARDTLDKIMATSDGQCEAIEIIADVSQLAGWVRVYELSISKFQKIDGLVNNAGWVYLDVEGEEEWRQAFDYNLTSLMLSAKTVIEHMTGNGYGRVVNMFSKSLIVDHIDQSAFLSNKLAVVGYTRGLANEVGIYGVTVNTVGLTLPASTEQGTTRRSMREDVTGIVTFLTSQEAYWISGQTVMDDGSMYR